LNGDVTLIDEGGGLFTGTGKYAEGKLMELRQPYWVG
jgi:hypothetical protein